MGELEKADIVMLLLQFLVHKVDTVSSGIKLTGQIGWVLT